MSFYADNVVLMDMINGDKIQGKEQLSSFFNWSDEAWVRLNPEALVIKSQVSEGQFVVTKGHFTSFRWGELSVGPMQFVTIHKFDRFGKIVEHTDWINYPSSLVNYEERKDSNQWIQD